MSAGISPQAPTPVPPSIVTDSESPSRMGWTDDGTAPSRTLPGSKIMPAGPSAPAATPSEEVSAAAPTASRQGTLQSVRPLSLHSLEPSHRGVSSTSSQCAVGMAPPVPQTRGAGHTPRGAPGGSGRPPSRPPSRTSSRFGTPRVPRGQSRGASASGAAHASAASLPPAVQAAEDSVPRSAESPAAQPLVAPIQPTEVRQSVATSDHSIAFHVEEEQALTSAASVSFRMESATRPSELSRAPPTTSEGSEIRFSVAPTSAVEGQSQASHPDSGEHAAEVQSREKKEDEFDAHPLPLAEAKEEEDHERTADSSDVQFMAEATQPSRTPALTERAVTGSMTSLQFEVDSTTHNTHQSSFTRHSVPPPSLPNGDGDDGEESRGLPVEEEEGEDDVVLDDEPAVLTESEERRRAQKAEEERRKKALEERSNYMNVRPWDSNAPQPRARRTSSQAVAHRQKQAEQEKLEAKAKRHREMNARPWRDGNTPSSTPRRRSVSASGGSRRSKQVSASMNNNHSTSAGEEMAMPMSTPPQSPTYSMSASEVRDRDRAMGQHTVDTPPRQLSARYAPSSSASGGALALQEPVTPVFDAEAAAKFVQTPPVLKPPMQVLAEEVDAWSETASQQRNLRAIAEVMREREHECSRASQRIAAQEETLQRLTRELYLMRDAYVRRSGCDVTGEALPRRITAEDSPGRESAGDRMGQTVNRLYPRPAHEATDYVALKQRREGGPRVSVLSDDDVSDIEKGHHAKELDEWRRERKVLRNQRARLAGERRDLRHQIHRGSNIKDLSITRPTSARAPLERKRAGTDTAVDIDGYDYLMDLRLTAQKEEVQAMKAKADHEDTCGMVETMNKKYANANPALRTAMEEEADAREAYDDALARLQKAAESTLPVLDRAYSKVSRKEQSAMKANNADALASLRQLSDAVLAVRLQRDRVLAVVEEAPVEEDRMRRAPTPRVEGMSRSSTPRAGSMCGTPRTGLSPRGRRRSSGAISVGQEDVFARLTSRRPSTTQNDSTPALVA